MIDDDDQSQSAIVAFVDDICQENDSWHHNVASRDVDIDEAVGLQYQKGGNASKEATERTIRVTNHHIFRRASHGQGADEMAESSAT